MASASAGGFSGSTKSPVVLAMREPPSTAVDGSRLNLDGLSTAQRLTALEALRAPHLTALIVLVE
jgi:hypothetical protein